MSMSIYSGVALVATWNCNKIASHNTRKCSSLATYWACSLFEEAKLHNIIDCALTYWYFDK